MRPLVLLVALFGCAAVMPSDLPHPAVRPLLPFTSLAEAPVTASRILRCPDGRVFVYAEIARPGAPGLVDYRILYYPETRRVLIADFSASADDPARWRALVGRAEGPTHELVIAEVLPIAAARERFIAPCDADTDSLSLTAPVWPPGGAGSRLAPQRSVLRSTAGAGESAMA